MNVNEWKEMRIVQKQKVQEQPPPIQEREIGHNTPASWRATPNSNHSCSYSCSCSCRSIVTLKLIDAVCFKPGLAKAEEEEEEQEEEEGMALGDGTSAFFSGWIAGFATTVALHPLDLIKTRFQVDESFKKHHGRFWFLHRLGLSSSNQSLTNSNTNVNTNHINNNNNHNNLNSKPLTTQAIKQELGLKGLYRGLVPAIIGSSLSWAIYFVIYEEIKLQVSKRNSNSNHNYHNINNGKTNQVKLSPIEYLASSATAGAITTLCTNPVWLIKTRMELQTPGNEPYKGFFHALKTIVRTEGIQGLYRGIVPALILVSNGGIQFMVYEELKWKAKTPMTGTDYMILGAASKAVASTFTYPYQLVKARMQQHQSKYTSTTSTFREIINRQGFFALYRGLLPNLIRVMPASAITMASYELTKKFISKQ